MDNIPPTLSFGVPVEDVGGKQMAGGGGGLIARNKQIF